jgi:hypothetical protein
MPMGNCALKIVILGRVGMVEWGAEYGDGGSIVAHGGGVREIPVALEV